MENTYLYHHGILGQKWGRHQGPPYPLGASDHSALEKKEGYKKSLGGGRNEKLYDRNEKSDDKPKKRSAIHDKLTKNYSEYYQKKYKLSKQDADKEAEERYDTVKKIAIGLGVTIGAATAIYAARKIGRAYVDDVIKSGTTIQTVQHDPNAIDKGKRFYASYRKIDNFKYVGGFGRDNNIFGTPVGNLKKKVNINAENDIKIAGEWESRKVFKELLKNPDFSSEIDTKSYKKFNRETLLGGSEEAAGMFYDALKKKGYGGVRDVNDSRVSGYNTKAAIIFDKDNLETTFRGTVDKKVSNIDQNEYIKKRMGFLLALKADQLINPATVSLGSGIVGNMVLNNYDTTIANKYRKKKNAEKINKSKKR